MTNIAIDFYPRPKRARTASDGIEPPENAEPVASVPSSLRFQLSHMLSDLSLRAGRHSPRLPPGRYPVSHAWKPGRKVELTATIDGHAIAHSYRQSALRGDETLTRWLAESDDPVEVVKKYRSLMFIGRPMEANEAASRPERRGFRLRAVDSDAAELTIRVDEYEDVEDIDLDDLLRMGGTHFSTSDLPVVIPRALLVALAADEAARPEPFVERGWYVLGRIGRNGDDLCLIAEDIIAAEHTRGTDTSLDWSAETKIALVAELDRRRDLGVDQQVVGWIHSHGPILETDEELREALAKATAKSGPIDFRFFSRIDVTMHRKDFGPAAIALVLDAAAARNDPDDPGRCFACFGTVNGVVVRRGVYLSERAPDKETDHETNDETNDDS